MKGSPLLSRIVIFFEILLLGHWGVPHNVFSSTVRQLRVILLFLLDLVLLLFNFSALLNPSLQLLSFPLDNRWVLLSLRLLLDPSLLLLLHIILVLFMGSHNVITLRGRQKSNHQALAEPSELCKDLFDAYLGHTLVALTEIVLIVVS